MGQSPLFETKKNGKSKEGWLGVSGKKKNIREGVGVLMRPDNSRATRTRLGQNSTRVSSTRNVNESSRATRNST